MYILFQLSSLYVVCVWVGDGRGLYSPHKTSNILDSFLRYRTGAVCITESHFPPIKHEIPARHVFFLNFIRTSVNRSKIRKRNLAYHPYWNYCGHQYYIKSTIDRPHTSGMTSP